MDTMTAGYAPEFPPDPPRRPHGREKVHVAGAGTLGMMILVGSLSILFISSLIAFLYYRANFLKHISISLPDGLWISTALLLVSSLTVHMALHAIRRDHHQASARWLTATLVLGVAFLAMQLVNWLALKGQLDRSLNAVRPLARIGYSPNGGLSKADAALVEHHVLLVAFYMFTILHAIHVIAGLIPLLVVTIAAHRGKYSRNYHPGIRYIVIYWHFLDAIWLVIFATLLMAF